MDLVSEIHASPYRAVIAITGGGSGSLEKLLSMPGASATVLEAIVPYSLPALRDWLGREPEQACSAAAARQMAVVAFNRARQLANATPSDARKLIGLGCTASLASNRPKKGEHRLHVAAQTASRTLCLSLTLEKEIRTRKEEEQLATRAVLATLADAAEVRAINLDQTPPGIEAHLDDFTAPQEWVELLLGERKLVSLNVDSDDLSNCVLLSGSFNPLHSGHEEIAILAEKICGRPVVFELAIHNVEKPSLDYLEIKNRVASLEAKKALLTGAPTFVEKARLTPGCIFAVGADTLSRIAEARFYAEGESGLDYAIDTIAKHGCRFLVFGRTLEGSFHSLDDLELPSRLRALCKEVPQSAFHVDLTSTELRNANDS